MVMLNRAYAVLSDDRLRRIYNDYLTSELQISWNDFLKLAQSGAMMVHFGVRSAKPTLTSDSFANQPTTTTMNVSAAEPPPSTFVRPISATTTELHEDSSPPAYQRQYSEPYMPPPHGPLLMTDVRLQKFRNGELF